MNFYSPLWLIQAVLPSMRISKNGVGKVIVNVSSTQGRACDPSEGAYESSKHALEGMSGVLAKEVHGFGIRVLVVNLGSFRTAFSQGDRVVGNVSAKSDRGEGKPGSDPSPYYDPDHPVRKRIDMVLKYASIPDAAKGDTTKGAKVLFDAVMKTEGSEVNNALGRQREIIEKGEMGGISKVESLILGSDALPKMERQARWFEMQVETCRVASGLADADGMRPLGG